MTRRPGLAARLLAAEVLVVGVGGITLVIVAVLTGPPLFREHARQAAVSPAVQRHLEDAFTMAGGVAAGVGGAAALVAAAAVSLFIAGRVIRPIRALDVAASRIADGDYAVRMVPAGLGRELDTLAGAFNAMAAALQATETTRRRLLADVAHELRTPLATLDAFVEGLADGVRPAAQETWDVLVAQTARLRRLADDISLVSSAEEGHLELRPAVVAPADLVETAVAAARPGYDARGVRLVVQLAGGLPALEADPQRLAQVLAGLLSNALRHTQPGGQVTVAARAAGPAVRITVADTGGGIPAEHLPHVFERFYRVDPSRDREHGGSGIGLTIARALVAAHGGTITAASQCSGPGAGTQFVITLPLPRS